MEPELDIYSKTVSLYNLPDCEEGSDGETKRANNET
jgi:hypothetical protein